MSGCGVRCHLRCNSTSSPEYSWPTVFQDVRMDFRMGATQMTMAVAARPLGTECRAHNYYG